MFQVTRDPLFWMQRQDRAGRHGVVQATAQLQPPPPPRLPELLGVGQEVQGPLKGHGTGRGDEGGRESRLSSQLIC